ncbi:hypothetical protein C7410_10270 [Paraburkholderia silvatlantica]|uniref:Phage tail protein n=1 Tax=Paraburkholderia silvatlantica TaxID=321895 RepID=A0A2V4UTB4_9BURK|nr:hypothetical protein [Paraburkholderia silvatlantica]PYE27387.1 hypothetical protein C7410_10270 [Paraburkholderia silvatlantica]
MNLQDQIGVLEAGVDQLLQAAAAHAPRADERAAAVPQQESPVAKSDTEHAVAVEPRAVTVDTVADTAAAVEAVDVEAVEAVDVEAVEAASATATDTAEAVEPAAEAANAAHAQPELHVARPSQNEITLTIGGQTVTLNALQVGQMIEELSNARASMQPEPPPGIPPGWRFASTRNPMMAVQKQSNGDRLLVLRHTGHGWVPFTFSPDIVVQMYMLLTQR